MAVALPKSPSRTGRIMATAGNPTPKMLKIIKLTYCMCTANRDVMKKAAPMGIKNRSAASPLDRSSCAASYPPMLIRIHPRINGGSPPRPC